MLWILRADNVSHPVSCRGWCSAGSQPCVVRDVGTVNQPCQPLTNSLTITVNDILASLAQLLSNCFPQEPANQGWYRTQGTLPRYSLPSSLFYSCLLHHLLLLLAHDATNSLSFDLKLLADTAPTQPSWIKNLIRESLGPPVPSLWSLLSPPSISKQNCESYQHSLHRITLVDAAFLGRLKGKNDAIRSA